MVSPSLLIGIMSQVWRWHNSEGLKGVENRRLADPCLPPVIRSPPVDLLVYELYELTEEEAALGVPYAIVARASG